VVGPALLAGGRPTLSRSEQALIVHPSRRRVALLALLAVVAVAADAPAEEARHPPSAAARPAEWDADALQVADRLADKLRGAGKACTDYSHWSYPLLAGDYERKKLPIPGAVAACTGDESENLTFEVFSDPAAAAKFVEVKRSLLCEAALRSKIDYPGFPYVDGGTWIVEPDEEATAADFAKVLGGAAKRAACR